MYVAGLGPVLLDGKPDLYNGNSLAVQLNASQCDLLETLVTFEAAGAFKWYLQAVGCELAPLWNPPHLCNSIEPVQYTKTCYMVVSAAGLQTITMTVQPNTDRPATISKLMMVARKIGTMIPMPISSPWYDERKWAQTTDSLQGRTQKWVQGYRVRYAVSFCTPQGESDKGPWSSWIQAPYALPTLVNIPVGPRSLTQGRKLYRQFSGFAQEVVGTIGNNTDTSFPDTNL
ncbi:MAG TPA: hypothetical protein VES20_25650 [Bryobacteraceae bacterium]|nr:hypothetical protein [Bryobacteraceae bacterium]